jgi:serine/threonine protein kinase
MTTLDLAARIGPWQPGQVLGRGRHSTVYFARREGAGVADGIGEGVAIKLAQHADLEREHRLLIACAHPNIVRARGHGRSARGQWLAMEWAEGGPLSLQCGAPVRTPFVHAWLSDAASALAHVHQLGWVHRDVKPANLLLRADGRVVLADFGEAVPRGLDVPAAALKPGTVIGSPRYAAPEQPQGESPTPAADVYSLGVVLYEWLTGRPPFLAETAAEALAQHLFAPVPRLDAALAHWQPLLDAMLAKDPTRRLPDGQAVLSRKPS